MALPYSLRALNIYSNSYQRLETTCIMWDSKKQILLYNTGRKRLFWWSLNTCLGGGIVYGCCIYFLLKQFLSPVLLYPFMFLLTQFVVPVYGALWFAEFIASLLYGKDFVTIWNTERALLQQLCKRHSRPGTYITCHNMSFNNLR